MLVKKLRIHEIFRLISFIRKRAGIYFIALILSSAANSSFGIIMAFVNKELINSATSGSIKRLYNIVVPAVSAFIIICILFPIFILIKVYVIRKSITELKSELFAHIANLPVTYFQKNHSGEIISRLTNDVNTIDNALNNEMQVIAVSIFGGVGSAIFMFALDWRLSLMTIILGIISACVNASFAGPFRQIGDKLQSSLGILTQYLTDFIVNIRIIRVFDIGSIVAKKYMDGSINVKDLTVERFGKNAQLDSVNYLLSSLNLLGVFAVGAFMAKNGKVDFGNVVAIITLQNGLNFMLLSFGNFFAQLQGSLASSARVYELLDQAKEPDKYEVFDVINSKRMVEFDRVSFKYEQSENVLNDLSFSVSCGESLALVGKSGSGKSTIFNMLMGFYCPQKGNIVIDGKSMGSYTLQEIRDKITYVPQEPILFDGTIEDNIRYGNISATEEEIVHAAMTANAHEFIVKLSEGYKTEIGEGGNKLSGGQKQRIAIARAVLKNAPILLLDEATSSLDSENEKLVQEAINVLMKNRTVIIIAHRLSTIERVGNILVIEDGCVVEQGKHDMLINKKGKYFELYNSQFVKESEMKVG